MKQPEQASGEGRMHAVHRDRLAKLKDNLEGIRGSALLMENALAEVIDKGGTVNIQPQIAFLVGAIMRLNKDWGVVEQLQQQGVRHRPKANGKHPPP